MLFRSFSGYRYLSSVVSSGQADLRSRLRQQTQENRPVFSARNQDKIFEGYFSRMMTFLAIVEQSGGVNHAMNSEDFRQKMRTNAVLIFEELSRETSKAYATTSSTQRALGLFQFMRHTYNTLVTRYPWAGLQKDFTAGAAGHSNATKAGILLLAETSELLLSDEPAAWGDVDTRDEILAASFNGGYNHALQTFRSGAEGQDWTSGLRPETRNYIYKLRALKEIW